jgi:hypothetical protein
VRPYGGLRVPGGGDGRSALLATRRKFSVLNLAVRPVRDSDLDERQAETLVAQTHRLDWPQFV